MSCLYSSPEVTSLKLLALSYWPWIIVIVAAPEAARLRRTESQCNAIPLRFRHTSRSTKTRSPTAAATAGCIKPFRLPKQAQVSRVSFQAQYQAFVRFAVGSGAAL
jgi:hypothetical protein